MRTAAHFHSARVCFERLKRREQIAHTPRRLLHRRNYLILASANVFGLALLVSQLTLERPLRKLMPRLIPPTHFVLFMAKRAEL
jgi:hypothetical protein